MGAQRVVSHELTGADIDRMRAEEEAVKEVSEGQLVLPLGELAVKSEVQDGNTTETE